MSRTITIAIAGPADVHPDNAADLLDDHLDQFKDVSVVVPITEDHLSEGLQTVLDYLDEQHIPFTAVTSAEQPRRIQRTLKSAEFVETLDNSEDIEQHLVDILSTAREDGNETAVILLWGEDEEVAAEDRDRVQSLLELAYDQDVACLDLTGGLDSFSFTDDEEPAEAPEPEPEPEPEAKPARRRRKVQEEEEELVEVEEELTDETISGPSAKEVRTTLSKVQTTPPKSVPAEPTAPAKPQPFPKSPREWKKAAEGRTDEAQALIPPQPSQAASEPEDAGQDVSLEKVLSAVYAHLKATDEANAAVNLSEVRYRPLTGLVGAYLNSLEIQEKSRQELAQTGEEAAQKAPEPSKEEAPKRGRARTSEGDTVAVLRLEDGTYKKRGRGRPPAGATLVDIAVEEAQELGLVA